MIRRYCDRCKKQIKTRNFEEPIKSAKDKWVADAYKVTDRGHSYVDLCDKCQEELNMLVDEFIKCKK